MNKSNLVWIDTETTGLDVDKDLLLEIAVVITDKNLTPLDRCSFIIHQPDSILKKMNDWCKEHHTASGLVKLVQASKTTLKQAEYQILALVKRYVPPQTSPLCGNSIFFDRRVLMKHMPAVHAYLHYRNIDVSTVKELIRRWKGEKHIPKKKGKHRAVDDIIESIEELKLYRDKFFQ